jgi:hypothetical protein
VATAEPSVRVIKIPGAWRRLLLRWLVAMPLALGVVWLLGVTPAQLLMVSLTVTVMIPYSASMTFGWVIVTPTRAAYLNLFGKPIATIAPGDLGPTMLRDRYAEPTFTWRGGLRFARLFVAAFVLQGCLGYLTGAFHMPH